MTMTTCSRKPSMKIDIKNKNWSMEIKCYLIKDVMLVIVSINTVKIIDIYFYISLKFMNFCCLYKIGGGTPFLQVMNL